jgi:hypothetical protein
VAEAGFEPREDDPARFARGLCLPRFESLSAFFRFQHSLVATLLARALESKEAPDGKRSLSLAFAWFKSLSTFFRFQHSLVATLLARALESKEAPEAGY